MKRIIVSSICVLAVAALAAQAPTKDYAPTEELHKLKVENLQMKTALINQQAQDLQRQLQEAAKKLNEEWDTLEKDMRASVKPPAEYVFDRQKGAFVSPPVKENKP